MRNFQNTFETRKRLFIGAFSISITVSLILIIFELFTRKVYEMFVYKHTETIDYVKN